MVDVCDNGWPHFRVGEDRFRYLGPKTITSKWEARFLDLAGMVSTWSKDPSTKIGCVAVDDSRRVLSMGFNGFPMNVEDSDERLTDRPVKYRMIVHGELNCILNAGRAGVSLMGSTLYVHGMLVCHECSKAIIQAGITHVVCRLLSGSDERWAESWDTSTTMFREARVAHKTIHYVPS
jgi:dCMP deaminase